MPLFSAMIAYGAFNSLKDHYFPSAELTALNKVRVCVKEIDPAFTYEKSGIFRRVDDYRTQYRIDGGKVVLDRYGDEESVLLYTRPADAIDQKKIAQLAQC